MSTAQAFSADDLDSALKEQVEAFLASADLLQDGATPKSAKVAKAFQELKDGDQFFPLLGRLQATAISDLWKDATAPPPDAVSFNIFFLCFY